MGSASADIYESLREFIRNMAKQYVCGLSVEPRRILRQCCDGSNRNKNLEQGKTHSIRAR